MPSFSDYCLTWVSLTMDVAYLFMTAAPDFECGVSDKQIQGMRSDRQSDLWMEIPDTVQETVIKTISKKKICKKAK